MEGAKHTINPLRRKPFTLGSNQIVICLLDKLSCFRNELLMEIIHAGTPVRTATWRNKSDFGYRLNKIEIGAGSPGILPILLAGFGGHDEGRNGRRFVPLSREAHEEKKIRPFLAY